MQWKDNKATEPATELFSFAQPKVASDQTSPTSSLSFKRYVSEPKGVVDSNSGHFVNKNATLHELFINFETNAVADRRRSSIACVDFVQALIARGAAVDCPNAVTGRTPLHEAAAAASRRHLPIGAVEAVVKSSTAINAKDKAGNTPLHVAMDVLAPDVARLIIEAGGRLVSVNDQGQTPVDLFVQALERDECDVDADMDRLVQCGSIVSMILQNRSYFSEKHMSAFLWIASLSCPVQIVKKLLDLGAKVKWGCRLSKDLPHIIAALQNPDFNPGKKFDLLFRADADVNAVSVKGRTVVHWAAAKGNLPLLQQADKFLAKLTLTDNNGNSPVHEAARAGVKATACLRFLIENGADVQAANARGDTPLVLALKSRNATGCAAIVGASESLTSVNPHAMSDDLLPLLVVMRYDQLRVLANENAILDSPRPLRLCLELNRVFRGGSRMDTAHRKDFRELADDMEALAIDLLNSCPSTNVKYVLDNQLIDYALERNRKLFIASSAAQKYVEQAWYGDIGGSTEMRHKVWWGIFVGVLFLVFAPCLTERTGFLRSNPLVVFVGNVISYVVFIALLVASVAYNHAVERSALSPIDWFVFIFVVGLIVEEIRQFWLFRRHGKLRAYTSSWSNRVDVLILSLFIVYYILVFVAFSDLKRYDQVLRASYHVYAFAALFSSVRLLSFLQAHSVLGPMQVSFVAISKVTLMFLVILGMFMVGFSLGITSVYSATIHLSNQTQSATADLKNSRFGMWGSLMNLFWALFGMREVEDFEADLSAETVVGLSLIALWLVVSVIVLLNMLIALVSNAFQTVQDNADIEWKFARASIVREIATYPVVPVPVNLISFPISLCRHLSAKTGGKIRCCCDSPNFLIDNASVHEEDDVAWLELCREKSEDMVKRYRRRKKKATRGVISKDDLTEIQRKIAGLTRKIDDVVDICKRCFEAQKNSFRHDITGTLYKIMGQPRRKTLDRSKEVEVRSDSESEDLFQIESVDELEREDDEGILDKVLSKWFRKKKPLESSAPSEAKLKRSRDKKKKKKRKRASKKAFKLTSGYETTGSIDTIINVCDEDFDEELLC